MAKSRKEVDIVRGDILYDDGAHKFIWLGWEEQEEEGLVQTNQYLIVDNGVGVALDPGGIHVFSRVVANIARYIDIEKVEHLFYTHQDPDVSSGVTLWLSVVPNARVYISKHWVRFLPHFGVFDIKKMVPIDDGGGRINLPGGNYLEIIPAHFLHSEANFHLYDPKSKILFTGDLGTAIFPMGQRYVYVENFDSHVKFMEGFHKRYLVSNIAIRKYLDRISRLDVEAIAPQHGAIINKKEHVKQFFNWLSGLKCGIDIIDEIYR